MEKEEWEGKWKMDGKRKKEPKETFYLLSRFFFCASDSFLLIVTIILERSIQIARSIWCRRFTEPHYETPASRDRRSREDWEGRSSVINPLHRYTRNKEGTHFTESDNGTKFYVFSEREREREIWIGWLIELIQTLTAALRKDDKKDFFLLALFFI